MPRFADIAKGTRSVKTVKLPLPGDVTVDVGVRPLNGLELGSVIAQARAFAIEQIRKSRPTDDAKAIPEPREGDRLYDLGMMAAVLLVGCVDPSNHAVPFFASADEILESLDADRIALLYEEQQLHQDATAPRPKRMSGDEFIAMVLAEAAVEEDAAEGPFARLPRSLQQTCLRTLAKQYVALLLRRSQDGSDSEAKPSA